MFVPVSVIYVVVQRFYVACSRQLRRIESKLKAPIYSNFQETIQEKIQSSGRDRNYPIIEGISKWLGVPSGNFQHIRLSHFNLKIHLLEKHGHFWSNLIGSKLAG